MCRRCVYSYAYLRDVEVIEAGASSPASFAGLDATLSRRVVDDQEFPAFDKESWRAENGAARQREK